ncbi:MAG TPA: CVNH domain-containing protein [Stellaceae bacterium]
MRVLRGLLGAVALAGLSLPAHAQAPPPGTYQQSCGGIRMQGSTLIAICQDMNGRGVQTALNIANCSGDIGNNNGQLQCNGGQPPAYSGPGYQPGYGAAPGSGYPPPGYGPPPR